MIIGIDLGTTYSAAAYLTDDGPKLIPNALGEMLTPSVVGLDQEGNLLVGQIAKEFQVSYPERCASVFKRYMGTDWTTTIGNRKFTPEELSGAVLRSLKEDAEAFLHQPILRAVITVPAYFNDNQRNATIRAGQLAGLTVDRIINEPTAAAIAYGFHESGEEKTIVVFDLGGGTFDVSVVELFEGAVEVKSSAGELFLGGEDFTRTLAARILESQGMFFERAEIESPALVSRLLQQCERAKRMLSREESVDVRVPNVKGELSESLATFTVTRQQFQNWTAGILNRIEMPIRRGLGDAKLKRSQINEVILVGGATRMPAVVQAVSNLFGLSPCCRLNPDEVVALGAAVQAGLIARDKRLDDLVVTDVAPFTLGVEVCKEFGGERRDGYFLPIINRNTTIPVSRVKQVCTMSPNQTEVDVKVFQGESRRVSENLQLGEFSVRGIPRGPAGQGIDLRFTYDLNGVLEVEATVVATGKKTSLVITKLAQGLSPGDIANAIRQMEALKTHPRDEAQNQYLLKRAERLFQELPQSERERLADLIDGFEMALANQENAAIEPFREQLQIFLSMFDNEPGEFDKPGSHEGDNDRNDW